MLLNYIMVHEEKNPTVSEFEKENQIEDLPTQIPLRYEEEE